MSTNPATNLVPAIGSAVVPTIPADTKGIFDAEKSTTSNHESEGGTGKEGGGVAETANGSLPKSLAEYLQPSLTPPRPSFSSADRQSNLSTQAQAGSTYSSSTATLNSDNISTMVHTGGTHSPHPVRPLGESKVFDSPDSPAASATPSLRSIVAHNTDADADFASKLAETLLAADAAASTPTPSFSAPGPAALTSLRPEDNSGSSEICIGKTDTASDSSNTESNIPGASLQSFIDATPNPSFSSSDASLATGAHGAGALPTMSLEALNSDLRAEESLPADTPAPRIAADGSSSGGSGAPDIVAPNAITGSASLNSSNPNDRFPASFIDANIDANAPSSPSTLPAPPTDAHLPASKNDEVTQGDADSTPGSEGAIQQEQEDGREGKEEGQGEEHKKPKLMQRLKEKMHIRHPHA